MSTSAVRIQTNRANAELSTGPRTPEGKARSAMNSLQHGLTAKTALLPGEHSETYRQFRAKLVADLNPQGALEETLAKSMADVQWRLRRVRLLEQSVMEAAPDPIKQIDALNKLGLYEQRLTRTFQTTMQEFRRLQTERREREARDIRDAAKILKHFRSKQLPYNPADDGFVFSESQVDTWLRRSDRLQDAEQHSEAAGNKQFRTAS